MTQFIKMKKEFGKVLRTSRESKKLTQQNLATSLKLSSPQFVSNLERGNSLPPPAMLGELSKILGIKKTKMLTKFVAVKAARIEEMMNRPWRPTKSLKVTKAKKRIIKAKGKTKPIRKRKKK